MIYKECSGQSFLLSGCGVTVARVLWGQTQLLVSGGRFSEASLPSVKNRPGFHEVKNIYQFAPYQMCNGE
ncbi:MAG: hypothetical protein A2672_01280 [Candidatus Wildermuthbacteria bacterium RIFCSPHIGHO2_01_FULL_49_22b]|uniref:Uncharacterized protein n=1 Tax=Candidatus Wildermuthbacteria bacterium RIFCSPHIGHO2_01_FULL_49_22b TaxID=1802448 RepID=A0A1G2R0J4_9BACT|nr:MAG: hypothetical protein A2672_01280 [Candidatus Wildermuthbacteria bacterium RIFCSPHIGHO2_01_FULL_49_22b]